MNLSMLLFKTHRLIENKEGKRITQPEMAKRLGISHRTYVDYLRDVNQPMGVVAVLDILTSIDWDDARKLLEEWNKGKEKRNMA